MPVLNDVDEPSAGDACDEEPDDEVGDEAAVVPFALAHPLAQGAAEDECEEEHHPVAIDGQIMPGAVEPVQGNVEKDLSHVLRGPFFV